MAKLSSNIKYNDLLDLDVVGLERPREELLAVRNRLAKQANKQMTLLEKSVSPVSGQAYTYGAYEHYAMKYLNQAHQKRFTKNEKMTDKQLVHEINVMQKFLKAPSSKVSNMKKFEEQAIKNFEKMGLDKTKSKSFYKFISSGAWQQFRTIVSSAEVLEFVGSKVNNARDYNKLEKMINDYMNSERETSFTDFKEFINQRFK